jgi:hypothetical protein
VGVDVGVDVGVVVAVAVGLGVGVVLAGWTVSATCVLPVRPCESVIVIGNVFDPDVVEASTVA